MKALPGDSQKTWHSELIDDIAFIKRKNRYPITKKNFPPVAVAGFSLLFIARLMWPLFIGMRLGNIILEIGISVLLLLLVCIIIYGIYRSLRFDTITTSAYLNQNMEALEQFFMEKNLAYTRHPDAPEVFMIISRNLNMNGKKEHREVMVFIADDKRILVNSHFTGSKINITPPSKNYKRMAKDFAKWLNLHRSQPSTEMAVKTF